MSLVSKHSVKLLGDYASRDFVVVNALMRDGLSKIPQLLIEIVCNEKTVALDPFLGEPMTLEFQIGDAGTRTFSGICISAEHLGRYDGNDHILAEVSPDVWRLGRTKNSRVFQEVKADDIISTILSEHGISYTAKLSGSRHTRTYCIQYRETDLDFITRLMEEEGLYYFFDFSATPPKMMILNDAESHDDATPESSIEFMPVTPGSQPGEDHIHVWHRKEQLVSKKVALDDYDFTKSTADLTATKEASGADKALLDQELYTHPGRYLEVSDGEGLAKIRMQAETVRRHLMTGNATSFSIHTGTIFTMKGHKEKPYNTDYLITGAVHVIRHLSELDGKVVETRSPAIQSAIDSLAMPENQIYSVGLEAIEKALQYRPAQTVPWPEIHGIQTAIVTGPSGKEIYTDKFGRVKVQFHWDREGKKDEKTSCWVRTMMPWTGNNWGMIAVPRIGQEVVVQFEEGDPDRPLIIGMLYNDATMPPYKLPDNMTKSGLKTWSTPKGGGGFNALTFEDKKDEEEVYFQAERDYKQVVKNDATVEVGLEKKEKGDMGVTIHRNLTETLKTGDHKFTVEKGSQTIAVKSDKKETVEGKSDFTLTGNLTETIKQGNQTTTLDKGNQSTTLKMGNQSTTLKMGNMSNTLDMGNVTTALKLGNFKVDAKAGAVTITALQKIELKVGGSSVKIDMSGVTIKGPMLNIEGQAMTTVKGAITQVNGSGMLMLKGGVTMIN